MNEPKLTVYATTWCGDCHRAKAFLDDRGVAYREVDIESTPGAAELVMEHNGGKRRVPTIEIDGRFYGNPPISELRTLVRGMKQ